MRRAYSATVIDAQLPNAASKNIEVLHVMDPSDTMLDRIADRPSGGDPAAARGLLHDFVAALGSGSVSIHESGRL